MKQWNALLIGCAALITLVSCGKNPEEKMLENFIRKHVALIAPLEKEANRASWNAAITGDEADYKTYAENNLKIRQIYSNAEDFKYLNALIKSGKVNHPLLQRQLTILYNSYLENQIPEDLLKQIVDLSAEVERKFSTFRATMDGKPITSNRIEEILKSSTDSGERKKAWLASKQVGARVAEDVIQLAKLRNRAAQELGFDNYHSLMLATGEQDAAVLDKIFDDLYNLTEQPFRELKSELDGLLAAACNVEKDALMPWHYHDPFFQETPLVYDLNLDAYYADKDVKELAVRFYSGIGLPVESIIQNSDLYEKEGKNPHAFCTDIDRKGDVRILCNLKNNERWMETMLHELGHAVYDTYQDKSLPYLLRTPAHAFTTEAVAMFFGRLSRDADWMQAMLDLNDMQTDEIRKLTTKYANLKQLIFARWAMVMYQFEKELYRDPNQNLNALWWKLVEKYQHIQPPANRSNPDWAAKIHVAVYPCYYHNYVLGELLASQIHACLLHSNSVEVRDNAMYLVGQKEVGRFLRNKIFKAGNRYHWNEMIMRATGKPLDSQYFIDQFVKSSS